MDKMKRIAEDAVAKIVAAVGDEGTRDAIYPAV